MRINTENRYFGKHWVWILLDITYVLLQIHACLPSQHLQGSYLA